MVTRFLSSLQADFVFHNCNASMDVIEAETDPFTASVTSIVHYQAWKNLFNQ